MWQMCEMTTAVTKLSGGAAGPTNKDISGDGPVRAWVASFHFVTATVSTVGWVYFASHAHCCPHRLQNAAPLRVYHVLATKLVLEIH